MKISSLFEMTTTVSSPSGLQSQQAPKFGRDPNVLEDEKIEETTAGPIATVAQPMGSMQRRGKGSMFQGISSSEKFPNSRKAGIKEEAISEDDISEEQLLDKQIRHEFFNKSKARDIGNRPEDRDIMAKEEFDGGGEYNDEVDMVQNNLHTIVRVSGHLGNELQADENLPEWVQEKIAVAKSIMVTVMDYMISQHERGNVYTIDENTGSKRDEYTQEANALKAWLAQNSHDQYADHYGSWSTWNNNRMRYEKLLDLIKRLDGGQGMAEVAPPGAKAERMVKHIKKSYSKDGTLSPKEKSIAYATAWKAHNNGTVEGVAEAKPDFAKMFNRKIDKHNKAVVQTKKEIGSRIADIGAGGKEHNVKTDKAWDKQKGSLSEMDKSQTPPGRDGSNDPNAGKKEYTAKATTAKKVAKDAEKVLNKELNKKKGVAEGYQLDEGAVETITALVKKIPGIGKYYQMAQQYKPQLIEILKTSKSGKEVKQKMEQLAAGQSATVAESGMMKQLGGLAVGSGSILSTMWMNAMGMIDGVLAHAAAGEVGGAVASGSILGLIPVTLMLFAAMLLFKGSKQSSDEKAQAFQAQRGQQGVAEGAGETLQQQKIRTAISNGLAKSSQMGKTEYQSQPTNRTYFDNAGYASDKLTGIDSIDPDGTVVISIGDTRAADWVKKLAALGGMPGIKTREVQPKLAQGVAEESKGLWANIHAKRDRIKHGSGEHMRKPGSKGAPTADALRKSAK